MVRHKNRYILIKVNEVGQEYTTLLKLKEPSLYKAIMKAVETCHGDYGLAAIRAGFVAKYINEHTKTAIVRCRRGPHKLVTSTIPLIKTMEDKLVLLDIMYVGATLRHCLEFLKKYQQRKFNEYCVLLNSEEEKVALREMIMNLEKLSGQFL